MKVQPRLSRRTLLTLASAAVLAAVGVVFGGRSWLAGRRSSDDPAAKRVEPTVLESIAPMGAAYLELHPEEADAAHLRRALGLGDTDLAVLMRASAAPLRERLDRSHRDDFRHARVVKLDGWTFSQTELRLAALAQLNR